MATGEIKEKTTTMRPPSIRRGIIGTKKILAIGETNGKSPEKYIKYGSINIGKPQARIKSSRRFILPLGIQDNFSSSIGKKVMM
jgi:hypothetical protein